MNILVCGATGVVGRRLVPALLSAGHAVTAIARTDEARMATEGMGARAVAADILDAATLRAAVDGQHAVVNLATRIPPSSRILLRRAWRDNDRVRSTGAANLARAASEAHVGRYVQESFAPIYADGGDRWLDETAPIAPARYNRSVLDAEAAAAAFAERGGTAVVLRFALFYGADAEQTRDMVRFVRTGFVPLPARADAYISSVSHDDAASAAAAALELPSGTYNVVDDEPLTRRAFFDSLADALGVRAPKLAPSWLRHVIGPVGETLARSLRISNRKLRTHSTWRPAYPSVRDGWAAVVRDLGAAHE